MSADAILLLSGGVDSTTLLAQLSTEGVKLHCLTFDYGQTLKKEVTIARNNAEKYRQEWQKVTIDLSWLNTPCSLLGKGKIPTNRTPDQIDHQTPTTYVPFRNGIFLAYAVAFGESNKINRIFCGGNGLYSGQYPDDTALFAWDFQNAANSGTSPAYNPKIRFPYANTPKSNVVAIGKRLSVDYSQTWSCYQNGLHHCGKCDSCYQRLKAFKEADL